MTSWISSPTWRAYCWAGPSVLPACTGGVQPGVMVRPPEAVTAATGASGPPPSGWRRWRTGCGPPPWRKWPGSGTSWKRGSRSPDCSMANCTPRFSGARPAREDDSRAPPGRYGRRPVRGAVRSAGRRQGRARTRWPWRRPPRTGRRCSSSTRFIASTRGSRTPSCRLSRTARSSSSVPPPEPCLALNNALLSRARVYVLKPLADQDLVAPSVDGAP